MFEKPFFVFFCFLSNFICEFGLRFFKNMLFLWDNIYNKKACIALGKNASGASNAHWALSAVQLLVGVLFVVPFWLTGIRKAPELTADNWKELSPVGLFASLAHAFSVLALGAGAVSFVKARQ